MKSNDVMQVMTIQVFRDLPGTIHGGWDYIGTYFAYNFPRRFFHDKYDRVYWVVNDFPVDLWKALVEKYKYSIEELVEQCKIEYLEYKNNKRYVQLCTEIEENR